MFFDFAENIAFLYESVADYLTQKDFCEAISDMTSSFVRDGKLYWSLDDKSFVVVDPTAKKAYRVFDPTEPLSDKYLCDPALAVLLSISLENFIDSVNSKKNFFSDNTIHLDKSVQRLCQTVTKFLTPKLDERLLSVDGSFVRDGKLYWSLDDKSFVVVDPTAKKAYRVFDPTEPLSDKYLCENSLARLIDLDIHEFINLLLERANLPPATIFISINHR